ncbi:uncharacterized protein LOC144132462 [Amblyomma americanum]
MQRRRWQPLGAHEKQPGLQLSLRRREKIRRPPEARICPDHISQGIQLLQSGRLQEKHHRCFTICLVQMRLQRCDDSGSSVRQLLRPPDGRGVTRGGVKAGRKSNVQVGTQTRRCVRYSEMDATNFFSCCRTGCDAQAQTDLARRKNDALATSFEVRTLHVMF